MRLLFEDALAVTPEMFRRLFDLRPDTADSKAVANRNSFYIRTYRISVSNLQQVLQDMLFDGNESNTRMFAWLERVLTDDLADDQCLTLRYVGQTKSTP